ncbi:hypothetical protein ABVB69_13250 [Streptomyces sp. NPDC000349]|uniref:hypothetical protein n=1 Tax=unclassified Streptomyces TaxID=2593676 RepID=UPI0027826F9C|nr:hypothetical protein [Streptomyces sp. DSM 40167]MDQ0405301.1 hypothetical protein [Streptomyces sp. DSM 40167]
MRQYAVEIFLTRPATARELDRARRRMLFAANADRTRLMTVHSGTSPGRTLHRLRRRLDDVLPIDVLTTHCPDRDGRILLNVDLLQDVDAAIRREAAASARRPRDVLGERITTGLARERRERRHRLESQLHGLLAQHTPQELLACAAALLSRTPDCVSPPSPRRSPRCRRGTR